MHMYMRIRAYTYNGKTQIHKCGCATDVAPGEAHTDERLVRALEPRLHSLNTCFTYQAPVNLPQQPCQCELLACPGILRMSLPQMLGTCCTQQSKHLSSVVLYSAYNNLHQHTKPHTTPRVSKPEWSQGHFVCRSSGAGLETTTKFCRQIIFL